LFVRMFTKIGVTVATGALPVLLWAGAAGGQQSQSQSQSPSTVDTTPTTISSTIDGTGTGGGALARTGNEDLLPLGAAGVAVAGAVIIYGVRRRSLA
jgi:uncharacterized protein (UPF0218 family)